MKTKIQINGGEWIGTMAEFEAANECLDFDFIWETLLDAKEDTGREFAEFNFGAGGKFTMEVISA